MTREEKIEHSRWLIFEPEHPKALMCSFGKDSMAMLHLARSVCEQGFMYPIIYHRHPWFPFKNEFADSVIRSWNLEVHDYPPMAAGVKVNHEHLELVSRYSFGTSGMMDVPLNTEPPLDRRPFVCGLDWVTRPKTVVAEFPWKTVLIGHKSSDIDPFEGAVPLVSDTTVVGGMNIVFPLKDWTDKDVWDYIEEHNVPYDKRRYENRGEIEDKWLNTDYIHACTACVDPRTTAKEVWCPKFEQMVKNRGSEVAQLQSKPAYIKRAA